MDTGRLRKAIRGLGRDYDKDWRQIRLLGELLSVCGGEDTEVQLVVRPLKGLNDLRIADAHLAGGKLMTAFQMLGRAGIPPNMRDAWNYCVDSVAQALWAVANLIKGSP